MKRRALMASAFVGAVLATFSVDLGGARPVSDQPAVITFRCTATMPDTICPETATLSDGVRGDGQDYSGVLRGNGEANLTLQAGSGRTIWLDFRKGTTASCPICRRDFDTLFVDSVIVQTNVVDASGAEVAEGLRSIPIGGTSAARVKVAWNRLNSLGETVQWAVRFNPEYYPGSDHVTVRRTATNTWEVEAYSSDRALLVSNILRKRGSGQQEGPFHMPFQMRVVSQVP